MPSDFERAGGVGAYGRLARSNVTQVDGAQASVPDVTSSGGEDVDLIELDEIGVLIELEPARC